MCWPKLQCFFNLLCYNLPAAFKAYCLVSLFNFLSVSLPLCSVLYLMYFHAVKSKLFIVLVLLQKLPERHRKKCWLVYSWSSYAHFQWVSRFGSLNSAALCYLVVASFNIVHWKWAHSDDVSCLKIAPCSRYNCLPSEPPTETDMKWCKPLEEILVPKSVAFSSFFLLMVRYYSQLSLESVSIMRSV